MPDKATPSPPNARWQDDAGGRRVLFLEGDWLEGRQPATLPDTGSAPPEAYDCSGLGRFDSTLAGFLTAMIRASRGSSSQKNEVPLEGLPDGLAQLVRLALTVPEHEEVRQDFHPGNFISRIGFAISNAIKEFSNAADFTGRLIFSFLRLPLGRARFRARDFRLLLEQTGPNALPIVLLISFLIGSILAFVGHAQLALFGASIFVADLVAIAMVREMGALMTGIIMGGRTGAAYAAQLSSMNANEEIDALRTFGFSPFDFLVLPRVLALIITMPILTLFANLAGFIGGMLVAASLGTPPVLFYNEALTALTMQNSFLGVGKSLFFGAAIAMSGCYFGFHAQRSSEGVGLATTRAVVVSITAIIVINSAFAALFSVLGI